MLLPQCAYKTRLIDRLAASQVTGLGFYYFLVPEMSAWVSARSAPCRVIRVSKGQHIAGFAWHLHHLPGGAFRDISRRAGHHSSESIFVTAREFEYDLTSAETLSGTAQ